MSRKTLPLNNSSRAQAPKSDTSQVLYNENEEKIRKLNLQLQDAQTAVTSSEDRLRSTINTYGEKSSQTRQDLANVRRLRDRCKTINSVLDRLSDQQNNYMGFVSELDLQSTIKSMNEEKDKMMGEVDIASMYGLGEKSEALNFGLDELRQITGDSAQEETRKQTQEQDILAEFLTPQVHSQPATKTQNNTNNNVAKPVVTRKTKYSNADNLLSF